MITRKYLHQIEMELVNLCEDIDVDRKDMRKIIIDKFTNLISEVAENDSV
jgi:hypothetical protein